MVFPVSLLGGSAKYIPTGETAFDAIVMTWTLCSIPNPTALMEMRQAVKLGVERPDQIIGTQRISEPRGAPSAIDEYGNLRVGEHFDRLAAEDNRRDPATPV